MIQAAALTVVGQSSDFWEKPLGPDGGEAYQFSKDSTGRLYAEILTGGVSDIYYSEDGGDSWQRAGTLPESNRMDVNSEGDLLGRRVATLVNGTQSAGRHSVTFNARNLSSGIYIYRLEAGDVRKSKKMLLVK